MGAFAGLRAAARAWVLAIAVATVAAPAVAADTAPASAPAPTAEASTGDSAPSSEPPAFSFGDTPIAAEDIVVLPPPKPAWQTIGGPVALLLFFFGLCYAVYRFIPFRDSYTHFRLRDLPVAAQRGIAMAVVLFGVAYLFGAFEVRYQMQLNGSAEAWFAQMSVGHLIVITHVHLFGFTTSFFIIGIPFSLHFYRSRIYQWIFPIGLAASLCDVAAWWGMKFVSPNFEYITWFCGALFSITYLWMLVGLVRVLCFPNFHWFARVLREDERIDIAHDG